jgi:hypothetical protein
VSSPARGVGRWNTRGVQRVKNYRGPPLRYQTVNVNVNVNVNVSVSV